MQPTFPLRGCCSYEGIVASQTSGILPEGLACMKQHNYPERVCADGVKRLLLSVCLSVRMSVHDETAL